MTEAGGTSYAITGVGLRCAVGQDAVHGCAAVRAGISRFREWPCMEGPAEEEEGAVVAAAVVPDLGDRHWIDKVEELATQPLLESLWAAGLSHLVSSGEGARWGICLSVPPLDRPGVAEEDAEGFEEEVRENTLFPFETGSILLFANGHAGGLLALDQAMRSLAEGRMDLCVVGGVDSLLESEYLSSLLEARKVKAGESPEGIVPGEAAGFVVVETLEHARGRGAEILARVAPVRTAMESAPSHGENPGRADGATRVLQGILTDPPCAPEEILRVVNDLNGERWRFLEWAMADARALATLPPRWRLWHPADCFGDIGAATGAAHLCIATRAFRRGYAAGQGIIVCNSSDSGERAATIVLPAGPGG